MVGGCRPVSVPDAARMAEVKCPICGKLVVLTQPLAPTFPFCGTRCRTLDLGRWADGGYVVPGAPVSDEVGRIDDYNPRV